MYRTRENELEFLLAHPGGPFWARKDAGAWSIPKGEYEQGADALEAAKREFNEETGCAITGNFIMLVPLKQRSGKTVHAWAVEGDLDATSITSADCDPESFDPGASETASFTLIVLES